MTELSIQHAFHQATQHHRAGRLREAEQLYRQILAQQPQHADAMHLLGVIAAQAGRHDVAVALIRDAIALKPAFPDAYANLGAALKELGRLDEAIAACRQAIAQQPGHASAYNNLANALTEKNLPADAVAAYRKAIALHPKYVEAYTGLGNALCRMDRADEAIAVSRQALALNPNYPPAHNNLGNALRDKGLLDEALAALRRAIQLNPNFPEAHNNLGNVLKDQRQTDESIAAYRQAIALNPKYVTAYNNLGTALRDKGLLDEALAPLRQALALDPSNIPALNNLAGVLKDSGEVELAVTAYRQVLALAPADLAQSIHSNICYALYFHPGYDDRAISQECRRWNELYAQPLKSEIRPHDNDRNPARRLKIGYVSPDFRMHAESFFVAPLLKAHSHEHFEVHCYASVKLPDAVTDIMKQSVDVWHDVLGVSDEALAEQIRRDQIDILIDVTMHMSNNRLLVFARKPAPLQVAWLAYPGTTGLDAIDYRITDAFMEPADTDTSFYAEKTVRLPGWWVCYDPLTNIPPAAPRDPSPGSPITFGSFNNPCKLNEPLLQLWARLMGTIPDSRLMLLARSRGQREKIQRLFSNAGIDPTRLEFVGQQSRHDYLRLYDAIDIALDPLPYNGITTTGDALWMGVPVVTLTGQTAASRAGLAMLTLAGLPELVAHTPDDFIRITSDLARDLPRLAHLRATLRDRTARSPIMDGQSFARQMETAYRTMWRTWCFTSSS